MIENWELYPKNSEKRPFLVVYDKNRTFYYIFDYTFAFHATLILKTSFYIRRNIIMRKNFLMKVIIPLLVGFLIITPTAHVSAAEEKIGTSPILTQSEVENSVQCSSEALSTEFIVKDQNIPNSQERPLLKSAS